MITLETALDKLTKEMLFLRSSSKAKFGEIVTTLRSLMEVKDRIRREVKSVSSTVEKVESSYKNDVTGLF
jgi:hypothetical protein